MPLAALLGPRTFFRFGSQRLRPNLFAVIVAGSSTLRKSEAIRWARNMVTQVDGTMLLPTAGSVEGLVEALKERPDGVLLFDEFARLLARSRRDFAQDLPQLLCELYDGSPVRERRRDGGTQGVECPIVSMLGATAPEPLLKYLGSQDVHSGLLPRFLLVSATQSDVQPLIFPPPMNLDAKEAYVGRLKEAHRRLESHGAADHEFILTENAREAYLELYHQLRGTYPSAEYSAFVERHGPMAIKVACIVAYGRRASFQVDAVDIAEAGGWVMDSLRCFGDLLARIDAKEAGDLVVRDAQRVLRAFMNLLPENQKSGVQQGELVNRSNLSADRVWPALLHLTETGKLMPTIAGRRVRWWARPELSPDSQTPKERDENVAICTELVRQHMATLRYPHKSGVPAGGNR
jgi:hypothetical protein